MMRQLLTFVMLGATVLLRSQSVDSIKAEQAGDFIKIGYRILDSNPDQVFRVRVLCSINGGLNTELRSISGDVGDNIRGGRDEYFVVWDVLKDVDELNSADFIVRAELIADNSPAAPKQSKRNFNVVIAAELPGEGYGLRLGYSGKYGISAQFMLGKTVYIPGYSDQEIVRTKRISIDFTARIADLKSSEIHMLFGPSIGEARIEDAEAGGTNYPVHFEPGLEAGLAFFQKRTLIVFTVARLFPDIAEEGKAITKHTYLSLGYGIRF